MISAYPSRTGNRRPLALRAALGTLHGELAKIKEQLKLNSDTSSKPPSSDAPRHKREKKGKLPSGKKRGAQPGHPGSHRKPKPPDQVSEFHVHRPETCQHCGEALTGEDASPYRWQVTDIPPVNQTLDFLLNETRCTRAAKRFWLNSRKCEPSGIEY